MCTSTLIVGHGLIGAATGNELRRSGHRVHTVARRAFMESDHTRLDLAEPSDRLRLGGLVKQIAPDTIVLVHGPSDVTWTERNEAEATQIHVETAKAAAESGARVLFISTDNVFDGKIGLRQPSHETAPQNAYGRAKLAAEQAISGAESLTMRVSLVYGWSPEGYRENYGHRVLNQARTAALCVVPTDQIFTPILLQDVSDTIAAACHQDWSTRLLHLAGPTELSRYEFARLAYAAVGANPHFVRPCLRSESEWASRPHYSSLADDDLSWLGLRQPRAARDGLRAMQAHLEGAA